MLRIGRILGTALLVFYLLVNAYAYVVADSIIFPAPPASYPINDSIRLLSDARGEEIATIFLQAEAPDAPLLLYSHGNAEDLGSIRYLLEHFRKKGFSVLAYDYPGYGQSSGQPSEAGSYAAAEAVFHYAVESLGYPSASIRLYGRSLGSGPATYLAERYPAAGLVLESAFTSTFRVLTGVRLLPFDRFDNLARLPRVDCPLLIIHGREDEVIPFAHAERNARAVGPGAHTLWIDQAGHNDLIDVAGPAFWEPTLRFLLHPNHHASQGSDSASPRL